MSDGILVEARGLTKIFPSTGGGLRNVSFKLKAGEVFGVVGPDGSGKTTLLRILAGLLRQDNGALLVLGEPPFVNPRVKSAIGYMPQKFGLYEDLTVEENLDLYSELKEVPPRSKGETKEKLLRFAGLQQFRGRLCGKLSGGMKQKLGLACALLGDPKILLLDEPTVGVDPISRRELWSMVEKVAQKGVGVIWSTSYMEEAEKCHKVITLMRGEPVFVGEPEKLRETARGRVFSLPKEWKEKLLELVRDETVCDVTPHRGKVRILLRSGTRTPQHAEPVEPTLEDGLMLLTGGLNPVLAERCEEFANSAPRRETTGFAVEVNSLTKDFGKFRAVNSISFKVRRGEVFGLLGPNGAGKTTTFKMLCGLLKPTSGTAIVAGKDVSRFPTSVRARIGYMAQKFSLYGDLTPLENLTFFGGVYGVRGRRLSERVERMVEIFKLERYLNQPSGTLPLGYKQRLAMACATLHQPEILFLDEPTSGVDPITRREFWLLINSLASRGTTVILTTHFLDEAEYADRVALMHRGEILAMGTPDEIVESAKKHDSSARSLNDAFVTLIKAQEERGVM